MKVVEFLKQIEEIGYDENTEFTFGCVNGITGEYYDLPFKGFCFGEDLTGKPYNKDEINVDIDVDSAKEYLSYKLAEKLDELQENVNILFNRVSNKNISS